MFPSAPNGNSGGRPCQCPMKGGRGTDIKEPLAPVAHCTSFILLFNYIPPPLFSKLPVSQLLAGLPSSPKAPSALGKPSDWGGIETRPQVRTIIQKPTSVPSREQKDAVEMCLACVCWGGGEDWMRWDLVHGHWRQTHDDRKKKKKEDFASCVKPQYESNPRCFLGHEGLYTGSFCISQLGLP